MLHTLFVKEHNAICDRLKAKYPHWGDARLFNVARLVNAAEIAKIHTIEWTTQLLYDEALNKGMNANWSGLAENHPAVASAIETVMGRLKRSGDVADANLKDSAFADRKSVV